VEILLASFGVGSGDLYDHDWEISWIEDYFLEMNRSIANYYPYGT